jgi:hypothetical protein
MKTDKENFLSWCYKNDYKVEIKSKGILSIQKYVRLFIGNTEFELNPIQPPTIGQFYFNKKGKNIGGSPELWNTKQWNEIFNKQIKKG